MKKTLITTAIVFSIAHLSYAQWSSGSGNIYPTTITDNVGIGTTSPGNQLSVYGNAGGVGITYSAASNGQALTISQPNAGGNSLSSSALFSISNSGNNPYFNFDNLFYMNKSGYVGIGTTSPGAGLDIANVTSGGYNFRVTGGYANFNSTSLRHTYGTVGHLWDVNYGDVTSFNYHDGTTWSTNRLTFDNLGNVTMTGNLTASGTGNNSFAGNVGIGTAAPSSQLDLVQAGSDNNLSLSSGGQYTSLNFKNSGTLKAQLYWDNTNGNFNIQSVISTPIVLQGAGGNVGIGTTIPDEKLTVLGNIHANEVKVDLSVPGPDYVFEPKYKLTNLSALKNYLDKNHHLPEIPSAAQIEKDGISLGDMNMKLLKKVEELTLYILQQNERINKLEEALKPSPSK